MNGNIQFKSRMKLLLLFKMIRKDLFKIVSASLIVTMLALTGFASVEPGLAQAETASDTVIVTLNVDTGISITSPSDTTMSTSLGVSTSRAIATTTWNVKTNSVGGYTLGLRASSTPAMRLNSDVSKSVANFTETTPDTPEAWGTVDADTAEFGFSVFSTSTSDVSTGTWGTVGTSLCGATSTPSTALNYIGASSTADKIIATRTSTTTQTGADIVVCYAVEQGSNFYIQSGTYSAWFTATATTQ